MRGLPSRNKYVPFITVYMQRVVEVLEDTAVAQTKESSCLVQARWEWTTSADSGRWGSEFQAYRYRQFFSGDSSASFSYGYSVITTRNKLRGKGRSLSLRFRTEPFKDCQLLGWGLELRTAQEP